MAPDSGGLYQRRANLGEDGAVKFPEGPERRAMSTRFLDGLGYRAGKSDTPRFGATEKN